jgi:hypothetical protein
MTLTKRFDALFFAGLLLCGSGISSSLLAGPEQLPDRSKDKEVQMEQAQVCDPRWYISLGGGGDFIVGGDLTHGFSRPVGIPTIIGTAPGRIRTATTKWDDVYDDSWHIQGEIGYDLTRHIEIFGTFKYEHAEGVDRAGGNEVVIGGPFGSFPFIRDFGDYTSVGGELGLRYFILSKESRIRPFISLSGGASHTDSIDISTRVDVSSIMGPSGLPIFKGGFFDDSWVATGTAMLGLEFRLTCHWDLGVEGGIRYQSELSQNDRDYHGFAPIDGVAGVPLKPFAASNNDVGERWTVPVNGYVKFRF